MDQNLLQLPAVDESNQEIISVEDIYEITESLSTIKLGRPMGKNRNSSQVSPSSNSNLIAELDWSPQEEFVITLNKDGWNFGSFQGYKVDVDKIEVQLLDPLMTRAKDDQGKNILDLLCQ